MFTMLEKRTNDEMCCVGSPVVSGASAPATDEVNNDLQHCTKSYCTDLGCDAQMYYLKMRFNIESHQAVYKTFRKLVRSCPVY